MWLAAHKKAIAAIDNVYTVALPESMRAVDGVHSKVLSLSPSVAFHHL